jgi:tetratricopeptide (TPR) repeat protein
MKVCGECGARNADHSYLCVQCGSQLTDAAATEDTGYTGDTDQIPLQSGESAEELVARASDRLADGNPRAAVQLCQRALALEPHYLSAFSLLGMAHEEAGDVQAAVEAYENVLRIDPHRAAERQKVNLLKLQLVRTEPDREQQESAPPHPWLRYAPFALATAAALLVFVVGAMLIVSARNAQRANKAEQAYELAMEAGNAAMADGRYAKAVSHFQVALEAKPDDPPARLRMARAQDRLDAADPSGVAQLPKYIPSKGPNPFSPVVIPSTTPEEESPDATPSAMPSPVLPTPPPRSLHSPVTGSSRTGRPSPTTRGQSQPPSKADTKNDVPISPRTDPKPARPTDAGTSQAPATPPDRGPGEISIWASDRPAPRPSTSQPRQPAANPESLRAQADALKREGRYGEAANVYGQAIDAYEQQKQTNPQMGAVIQRSIESVTTSKQICESQQ